MIEESPLPETESDDDLGFDCQGIKYRPKTQSIVYKYQFIKIIYNERLSAATVHLVRRKSDGVEFVMKVIDKAKLFCCDQLHQARQECAI